jgi:hypothetical protein
MSKHRGSQIFSYLTMISPSMDFLLSPVGQLFDRRRELNIDVSALRTEINQGSEYGVKGRSWPL